MAKILFVMTGADQWTLADGSTHPTGFWAEEAVAPYEAFKAAGHEVTVATPDGVVSPVDQGSLSSDANGGPEQAARIRAVVETAPEFQAPIALTEVRLDDYAAVYVPGGHGPMEDLAVNADSRQHPHPGAGQRHAGRRGLPRPGRAARRGQGGRHQRLRRPTASPRSPTPRSSSRATPSAPSGCCRTV